VGKPDAVKIERRIDEKGVLLELTVDPEDLGRVIGKRGATAQSLRTLLRALGTKNDARYNLKIVDNGEPHESSHRDKPEKTDDKPAKSTKSEEVDEAVIEEVEVDIPAEKNEDEDDHSSLASKTRKELEDLDDLEL
jgi:predicted RNA-binding protein YlqC (UPF0109 family)